MHYKNTSSNAGVAWAWLSPSIDGCSAQCPAWHDWHQQQRATSLFRHGTCLLPATRDRRIMWELAYAGPGYLI